MCPGNGASQCALGMGLAKVPREWVYPMYPGNGTSQCAQEELPSFDLMSDSSVTDQLSSRLLDTKQ